MSGHSNFTSWINSEAKYILVNGEQEEIVLTFFTSDPMPNSDTFNIKTKNGVYELRDDGVDFNDLRDRYENK